MSIAMHTVSHGLGRPRTKPSIIKPRPLQLPPVVYLPDGRNEALRMARRTITRIRLLLWIHDFGPISVLRARTVRVLCSFRLPRNSDHCRLGGKCDVRVQTVCTSLTKTPRRQRGMTHGCLRRWYMQICCIARTISTEDTITLATGRHPIQRIGPRCSLIMRFVFRTCISGTSSILCDRSHH